MKIERFVELCIEAEPTVVQITVAPETLGHGQLEIKVTGPAAELGEKLQAVDDLETIEINGERYRAIAHTDPDGPDPTGIKIYRSDDGDGSVAPSDGIDNLAQQLAARKEVPAKLLN